VDALSPGDVLNSVHVTAACTRRTVARHGIGMTARAGRQQACRVVSCRPGVSVSVTDLDSVTQPDVCSTQACRHIRMLPLPSFPGFLFYFILFFLLMNNHI
jgi:hypothetical protein